MLYSSEIQSSPYEQGEHTDGIETEPDSFFGFEDYHGYDHREWGPDEEVYVPMNELMSGMDACERGIYSNSLVAMPYGRQSLSRDSTRTYPPDTWKPGSPWVSAPISAKSDIYEVPIDYKSPYNQFLDMEEERARLDKEEWYLKENAKLPEIMMIIMSATKIISPLLAGRIIEYIYPIHPDDVEDTYDSVEETCPEEEPEPKPKWQLKGFQDKDSYDSAVKEATKKWQRTLSLAKRWGSNWRWKRHEKANTALIAITCL